MCWVVEERIGREKWRSHAVNRKTSPIELGQNQFSVSVSHCEVKICRMWPNESPY